MGGDCSATAFVEGAAFWGAATITLPEFLAVRARFRDGEVVFALGSWGTSYLDPIYTQIRFGASAGLEWRTHSKASMFVFYRR